jgi:peptidoglycan/xylan/chitin deacetylase (PgdA/CDA1 family)
MRIRSALLTLSLAACRPESDSRAPDAARDPRATLRVAVTVDDLPSHGPLPPGGSRLELHEAMLSAFARHGIEAYGFVNGARIADGDDERAAVQAWVAAGQPLGNHSLSHPRMQEIGVVGYLDEIDANEAILGNFVADPRQWRVFRYPYLFEGTDPETTMAVRDHLDARGYRIAQVTVDFYDWSFNAPYVRCLSQGNDADVAALEQRYLDHARTMLRWSEDAAQALWQRDVAHVLLLHVGAMGADMLDALLDAYEAEGVAWIGLAEAMDDPIYRDPPVLAGPTTGTYLDQVLAARAAGAEGRPPAAPLAIAQPIAGLDAVCPDAR